MKKYFLAFIITLTTIGRPAAGGHGSSSIYSLLSHPSARSAGLSGACTAIRGDISLMQHNPSSLLGIPDITAMAAYHKGPADELYATVLGGMSFEDSALAFGIKYYDTGEISIYNLHGYEVKNTGQRDTIVMMGSAQDFGFITAGMNLKMFFSNIFGETAFGFAGDIGFMRALSKNINSGLSVQNIGTPAVYISEKENLPVVIRSGITYEDSFNFTDYLISLDIPYYVNEEALFLKTGLEVALHEHLTFRTGVEIPAGSENKSDNRFSLGWSFGSERIKLDYSVQVSDNLKTPQHISTEVRF